MARKVALPPERKILEQVVVPEFENSLNGSIDLVLEKLVILKNKHKEQLFVKCVPYGYNGEFNVVIYKMVPETDESFNARLEAYYAKQEKLKQARRKKFEELSQEFSPPA